MEHILEICFWILPGSYGITKEYEIFDYARGVNTDHVTDASKGRIFLFVVSNVAKGNAPVES